MMGQGSRSNALDDHKKILAAAKARALNRVRAGRDAGATSPLDEAGPPTPPADAMTQEPPAIAAAGPSSDARIQELEVVIEELRREQAHKDKQLADVTEERDDAMRQAAEGHVQVTRVKIEYDARLQTTLAELQETVEALAGAEASIAQLVHDNGELRARLDAQAEEHAGQHSAVVTELDSERERLVTEARRLHERLAAAEEHVAQAQQSERVAMETAEQAREEVRQLQESLASRDAEMAALKDEVQAQGARLKAADRAREEQIERSSSAGSLHGSDSTSDMQWARREAEYLSLVNGLKHRVEELEAAARDKDAVVATVHSNAQTLSRIMAQNRDLKQQLAEIQERFVYVTQQHAEHMLAKEAAEHDARQWRVKAEALEAELDGETDVGVAMVDNEKLARAQRHAEQLAEQVLSLQKDRLDLRTRLDALAEQLAHAQVQVQAQAHQHDEAPPAASTTEQGAAVPAPARENGDAEARELELLECIEQLNSEKERLEALLEHERGLVGQLAAEADAVPTYIALYHEQRKKMGDALAAKDSEIARLVQQLAAIEAAATQAGRATPIPAAV